MDTRASPTPKPLRILIAEDHALVALALGDMVQKLGHEVVGTVETASEAIEVTENLRPDFVLMDVDLRDDLDGVAAALLIHERVGIRCLFVSGMARSEFESRTHRANPLGFVSKGSSMSQVRDAIERAAERL